jgi:hypothetical protein
MNEYHVTWEIDVSADSPREAAWEALKAQRNPGSIATVFTVAQTLRPRTEVRGETVLVDLEDPDGDILIEPS